MAGEVINISGMHGVFTAIYTMAGAIAILLLLMVFVLSFVDAFRSITRALSQRYKMATNQGSIFLKDTQENNTMQYISVKMNQEPYAIYTQQQLVAGSFQVVRFTLFMLAIHVACFFGIMLYASFNKMTAVGDFPKPIASMGMMFGSFLVLAVCGLMYQSMFVRKARYTLEGSRGRLRYLKGFIYKYLTTHSGFLQALRTNNIDSALSILKTGLRRDRYKKRSDLDYEGRKMIFTLSLYQYFRFQIPDSDPAWEQIQNFFTPESILDRKFDPTEYLYFGAPISIPNIYPLIADLKDAGNRNDVSLREALGPREFAFRTKLAMIMRDFNKRLSFLKYQTSGNRDVVLYIWAQFVFLLLVMFVLFFLVPAPMREKATALIGLIAGRLMAIFRSIVQLMAQKS